MKKLLSLGISVFVVVNAFFVFSIPVFSTNQVYKDNNSNIEFCVPENWEDTPLTKPRQFIDIKYTSTKEKGLTILFGATDLFDSIFRLEGNITRNDLNDTMFTTNDIAEMFDSNARDFTEKEYNGIHFFCFQTLYSSNLYGTYLNITITNAIHIENGWAYWFQFGASTENSYYKDFEALLNSVNIKRTKNSSPLLLSVFLIVFIISIIIVFKRTGLLKSFFNKAIKSTKTTPLYVSNVDTPLTCNNSFYCHVCGTKLEDEVKYCHKCGTKINENLIYKNKSIK